LLVVAYLGCLTQGLHIVFSKQFSEQAQTGIYLVHKFGGNVMRKYQERHPPFAHPGFYYSDIPETEAFHKVYLLMAER
jgi:hypothetical protein